MDYEEFNAVADTTILEIRIAYLYGILTSTLAELNTIGIKMPWDSLKEAETKYFKDRESQI
jgi:hypothetical protein